MEAMDVKVDYVVKQVETLNKELIEQQLDKQYTTRIDSLKDKLLKLEAERTKLKELVNTQKRVTRSATKSGQQENKELQKTRAKMLTLEAQIDRAQERID